MDTAVASGAISPLKRTNITHISHLLFADDLLVFCKGSKDSAKRLNLLLNQLELNTGLVVNNKKSSVLNVGYQGNVGCRNRMSDFGFRRYFRAI